MKYISSELQNVEGIVELVKDFPIDSADSDLTFTGRLCREQAGWSLEFTERVVKEYLRFVTLVAVSDIPVTPSDEVDQAWHLHILYSQSYHELCELLGTGYLHHGPTKGGEVENSRFENQYLTTLETYRSVFGVEPPSDIWPSNEVRFNGGNVGIWVRPNTHIIFERGKIMKILNWLIILVVVGLLFSSSSAFASEGAIAASGLAFLQWELLGLALLLLLILRAWVSLPVNRFARISADCGGGCGGSGCSGGGCGTAPVPAGCGSNRPNRPKPRKA